MIAFFRKLMSLAQRRHRDAELREELEFHLDEEVEGLQETGMSKEQASWAAHRELGNMIRVQERMRGIWIPRFWEQLTQDLRYGLRVMLANKTFSSLAILSLALGIGANAAIYSFMDSILLRWLPVHDPASLIVLKWHSIPLGQASGHLSSQSVIYGSSGSTYTDAKLGLVGGIFPFPAFEALEKRNQEDPFLSDLFAYFPARRMHVMVKGQAEVTDGEYVSGAFFRGLDLPPASGRLLTEDDDRAGSPPVAVVSMAFGKKYFGSPANATGQTIFLDSVPVEIVGVAPQEFFGVDPATAPAFYVPVGVAAQIEASDPFGVKPARYLDQHLYWIQMMARLRPGVSLAQAQAALAPAFYQWVGSTASNDRERATLPELVVQEGAGGLDRLRRQYSQPLFILLALVGVILMIACANIANLMLARATARRAEIAVRLSLGAGRLRIVRQLLTESVLLAFLGGALGLLVAVWGIRFLTLLLANGRPDFTLHAELNWHVLAIAAALSLMTGILFGLAPALQSTRVEVVSALKDARAIEARSRIPLRQVLVVAQIALSMLMLIAAGLFVRTLSNLQSVALGFNSENVLQFKLNARQAGRRDPNIVPFYEELQQRLSTVPGVRSASLAISPVVGEGNWSFDVTVNDKLLNTPFLTVGPHFFTTMQIPLLAGREIGEGDRQNTQKVAVVNESFAKTYFGTVNVVGRHLGFGENSQKPLDMEIVGVARNARYGSLKDDLSPILYVPCNQGAWPVNEMTYVVRTAGDPLALVRTIHELIRQADPRVPMTEVKTQAAQIDQAMGQEIMFARLCSAFAFLALLIAAVGLYGSMSYNVARRTGEIGIRMALGAQRRAVVWMVLRQVIVLVALGLAISLPTAWATSRFVESLLYDVKAKDPLSLTIAVLVVVCAVLLASYLPARRASRIDPMTALRYE